MSILRSSWKSFRLPLESLAFPGTPLYLACTWHQLVGRFGHVPEPLFIYKLLILRESL